MKINDLMLSKDRDSLLRIVDINDETVTVIECLQKAMPTIVTKDNLIGYSEVGADILFKNTGFTPPEIDALEPNQRKTVHERYTVITPVLPFVSDPKARSLIIDKVAEKNRLCKQTVRNYLRQYLIYQDISALAPARRESKRELTLDEKNIRWALNKYYYTRHCNTLKTAYILMLRERYTDSAGKLMEHPSLSRFRYYYRKNNKNQKELISRNGIKDYQRNNRPLLGTIHDFAPAVGVGMLDSTICDIYLINESGQLVGRPLLTLCVDAYSSLICGYMLSWEGGVYSLHGLLQNVIADKKEWCSRFGISIENDDWPCRNLPSVLVTDRGREYISEQFEQIVELNVQLHHLSAFRCDSKGPVEKAFSCIQDSFVPYLRGFGVIEDDYQERGGHDYRKDACLTMDDFERIVLRCIIYYNSKRVLEGLEYDPNMLEKKIPPYANALWKYGCSRPGANLITVSSDLLRLTLLPRTKGRFSRTGLMVSGMRYRNRDGDYTERYLSGGSVIVSYDPDCTTTVWLCEDGKYSPFDIILKSFESMSFDDADNLRSKQKEIKRTERDNSDQALVDLSSQIEAIVSNCRRSKDVHLEDIRKTREKEKAKRKLKGVNNG